MPNFKSFLVTEAERKHVRQRARFQQHWDDRCHQDFFFLQGKAPKKIHAILTETLGEYAPWYATVKNSVAQFKYGDFSTCDSPGPGESKTVNTPHIIDRIHELILETTGFRLNQWLSNWEYHVTGLGLSLMKIWTCRSSPRSGSRNARTRIHNVNGSSRLSKVWNFFGGIKMISCRV